MNETCFLIRKAFYKMLLLVAILSLAGSVAPEQVHPPAFQGACSSFCLHNGGYAVFGSNYDNEIREGLLFVNQRGVTKSGWEAGTTGKVARWTAEYGSVTFNLAGAQLAWAGMNEAGLVISTMWVAETLSPIPDERPPLVSALWVQYQLDTCATLEDVMASDARVRIADTVDHYLVCDRSGDCAAIEFLEGKTLFHSGDAMPVEALTNAAYEEAVEGWQEGHLQDDGLGILAERLANFEPEDTPTAVAYAFETLSQVSGQATGGTPTEWSIVFDTENLLVHFRTSGNPQIRTVDFAQLDFACGTPVQMLDVYAPLSGDISHELDRYTFEANLQHTLHFLEQWGSVDVSPLEVEVLGRGMTSFPCERPAAPYQEERKLIVSPVVAWAGLALFHRLWLVGIVVGLGVAALVVWRAQAGGRRG